MASYNKVVLVGNLTRDPEFRTIQSGTSVAEIGLAVNERRKDANGNWIEDTTFVDVTVWSRSAEVVRDYTRKGSQLLVEGRLKQDVWEQDGQKRSKIKVVAERIVLLGSKDSGSNGNDSGYQQGGYQRQQGGYQQQSGYQRQQQSRYSNQGPTSTRTVDEYSQESGDDIPF